MTSRKGTVAKHYSKGDTMEELKTISTCNFCGEKKEVIPFKKSDRMICADCLIDLHDRIEGHFLPGTNNTNLKENRSCQNVAVASGT